MREHERGQEEAGERGDVQYDPEIGGERLFEPRHVRRRQGLLGDVQAHLREDEVGPDAHREVRRDADENERLAPGPMFQFQNTRSGTRSSSIVVLRMMKYGTAGCMSADRTAYVVDGFLGAASIMDAYMKPRRSSVRPR